MAFLVHPQITHCSETGSVQNSPWRPSKSRTHRHSSPPLTSLEPHTSLFLLIPNSLSLFRRVQRMINFKHFSRLHFRVYKEHYWDLVPRTNVLNYALRTHHSVCRCQRNLQESVLSFCYVGLKDWIQVVRLGSRSSGLPVQPWVA